MKLRSPAVARNTRPIADVLAEWLPVEGTLLEVASGSGEHAVVFAREFSNRLWQPSDPDSAALASIEIWRVEEGSPNLLAPFRLDASAPEWSVTRADAVVAINLVHISPWKTSLGLLDGAARILPAGGPLILYGPWRSAGQPLEPSNLAFDQSLKARDPEWGIREVEVFSQAARERGLQLIEQRAMPANNRMLLFRRSQVAD
ncbi:MAG TPA: DUF938 domain-containing protein [Sphingomicrobium sp.]|nr:DUF938 domain-containing protein [Sphingomicrobium sp.]